MNPPIEIAIWWCPVCEDWSKRHTRPWPGMSDKAQRCKHDDEWVDCQKGKAVIIELEDA